MKLFFMFSILLFLVPVLSFGQPEEEMVMTVKKTNDFLINGEGTSPEWNRANWLMLNQRKNNALSYKTNLKILYSDTGIYCLYYCEDKVITATMKEDFLNLWTEDVVEAFFWPDESFPVYFEYELSPLNYELPILVPNNKGDFLGWRPWQYEGTRKIHHATHIHKKDGAVVAWTAAFFIPYAVLKPLPNTPPQTGSRWRANFYRVDYDQGSASWSWALTRTNFHDYARFGTLVFE